MGKAYPKPGWLSKTEMLERARNSKFTVQSRSACPRRFTGAITRFFAHCLKGALMAEFYQI